MFKFTILRPDLDSDSGQKKEESQKTKKTSRKQSDKRKNDQKPKMGNTWKY